MSKDTQRPLSAEEIKKLFLDAPCTEAEFAKVNKEYAIYASSMLIADRDNYAQQQVAIAVAEEQSKFRNVPLSGAIASADKLAEALKELQKAWNLSLEGGPEQ